MKGMNRNDIREHMEVFGSCGTQLGVVDRVEEDQIKLAKTGGKANGQHHWIPADWVESVDTAVRLSKDCGEATREWRAESAAAGSANNTM